MDNSREQSLYEFGFASDVGRKRRGEPNQDAVEIVLGSPSNWHAPLLVVADGLGGYRGGAVASQLVIQAFKQQFKQTLHPTNYLELMEKCTRKAHTAVRLQGSQDLSLANMGSTVVAVVVEDKCFYLINVGDSRAYLLRGNKVIQISKDQSWVAEQVRAGHLTIQEALKHPKRNRLTMSIMAKRPDIKPYLAQDVLEANDIIVLCSDGLWGVIPEALIWAAASELAPQVAAEKLIDLANSSKGPDNISVIIARRKDWQSAKLMDDSTNPGE